MEIDKETIFSIIRGIIHICVISALLSLLWLFFAANSCPGIHRNEYTVASSLQTLAQSQEKFRQDKQVNQDNDDQGEYGLLNELGGTHRVRGSKSKMNPTYITPVLTIHKDHNYDYVNKGGYYYQLYLPHTDKPIIDTKKEQKLSKHLLSINAQEQQWIAYAWPIEHGVTGEYCFVVSNKGQVYCAPNYDDRKPIYEGGQNPPFNAAMSSTKTVDSLNWTTIVANGETAQDRQIWSLYDANKSRIWEDFFSKVLIQIVGFVVFIYLGLLLINKYI